MTLKMDYCDEETCTLDASCGVYRCGVYVDGVGGMFFMCMRCVKLMSCNHVMCV